MRELRSCDFCGTDAVGVFEVLPPELTPADDQRRVVLCDHCRETLTDVIEPLLTRLGVDSEVEVPDDAPAEASASAATSGMESDGDAVSVGVDSVDPAPTPPEPADHDSPDDDPTDEDPADDTADPLDDDAVQAEGGDDADADADAENPDTSEPDESTTADDEDESDRPSEPPQFRKVVRILQNREFPVERTDVEALASNAYDLDDEQVEEIFDYAVERGLLVDDGGTLRKP